MKYDNNTRRENQPQNNLVGIDLYNDVKMQESDTLRPGHDSSKLKLLHLKT